MTFGDEADILGNMDLLQDLVEPINDNITVHYVVPGGTESEDYNTFQSFLTALWAPWEHWDTPVLGEVQGNQ